MTTFAVCREGYMPIGTVQADTHVNALVLAEAMWGGTLYVTSYALPWMTMAEKWADVEDRDQCAFSRILRQIRRAA